MAQTIKTDGTTVKQMKKRLRDGLDLDLKKLEKIREIPKKDLKRVLGEPMVQSIVEFFVTADICEVWN